MVSLSDMECIQNEGILHKYSRRSDRAKFSVKTLIAPENTKPEQHPTIQTLQKLQSHSHPNLPGYYGYDSKEVDGFTEIYVFFEESEGSLSDYLKRNKLNKKEASDLVQQLIDVSIFVDRNAYSLPSYYTPYNIMVVKDFLGRILFKPFGFLAHDDNRIINEGDLKWIAPELYERQKLRRTHLTINAEKAVFYSIGIIALFAITDDLISNGRENVDTSHFTANNQQIESQAVEEGRAKVLSIYNDNQLGEILGKILTYNDKERPDFRVWQLSLNDKQAKPKERKERKDFRVRKVSTHKVVETKKEVIPVYQENVVEIQKKEFVPTYHEGRQVENDPYARVVQPYDGKLGKRSKKSACCAHGCNIF